MLKVASMWFLLNMSLAPDARTFPYAQFKRLMSEPNEIASAFVIYPRRDGNPGPLNGLNDVPHGNAIRIVSVERPISSYNRWFHWISPDGTTWVDIVDLPSRQAATELLQSAGQIHSGYRRDNQLLLSNPQPSQAQAQ